MDPRQQVHIDLEEGDVIRDIADVVDAMQRIRFETEETGKGSNSQRDEYVHLVHRLASSIDGLANDDTDSGEKVKSLVGIAYKEFKSNQSLMQYDPRQDTYWQHKNQLFVTSLDKLVISVLRENLNTMDSKHHIAQAIKYMVASDESPAQREKIYPTLLPFQSVVPLQNEGSFLQRVKCALLGSKFVVENEEPLTLKVNKYADGFDEVLWFARDRGYVNVTIEKMEQHEFLELKDQLKPDDWRVTRSFDEASQTDKPITIEVYLKPNEDLRKILESPMPYFEKIASLELPTEISDNLIWSAWNNYSFTELFQDYVNKNAGKEPRNAKITTEVDKKNHALVYRQLLPMRDYCKATFLACFSNSDYIVTIISKMALRDISEPAMISCLTTLKEEKSKAEDLANRFDAQYVRLRKFEKGEMKFDYEGVG
jgi:hypothetical protein